MAVSIFKQILDEIRSQIVAMDLQGIADSNVLVLKTPATLQRDLPATKYPAVVISPYGRETVTAQSNLKDDVTYPILIACIDSEAQDAEQPLQRQQARLDQYLTWRETIRRSFSTQRLTSTLVHMMICEPLDVVDIGAWTRGLWVSAILLNASAGSRGCEHRRTGQARQTPARHGDGRHGRAAGQCVIP